MKRFLVAAAAMLGGLYLWQGQAYLDYSDGVYSATAQAVLDGAGLYGDVAAAQPPLIYWFGSAVLWVHDSGWMLRAVLSIVLLTQAGLVACAVRRLTGSGRAAAAGGIAALLTPWVLREHTALLPETLGAPLLLGSAVAAARPGGVRAAGALAAVAVALKAAFVLPAVAVVLAARSVRGAALGFVVTGLVLLALTLLLYGGDAIDNIVVAQWESGRHSLRYVGELWAQALWNEIGLLALAGLAFLHRDRARDPALLRTLLALTLGAGLLAVSLVKEGTYLQFSMILEPPALALGTAGIVWSISAARRVELAVAAVAVALVAAQAVSVLASPEDPTLFGAPWSASRHGWEAGDAAVEAALDLDAGCPDDAPHPGPPYVAFLVHRPMPGGQYDEFILVSETHADLAQAVLEEQPQACPDSASVQRALAESP